MGSESPIVSVIVPAYNAQQYIADTIRSVLEQTLQTWELIIVNDGSTDKTAEIIAAFDDERIHLIEQANSGVSAARNVGLDRATGSYITFLDADDILPPRSLQVRAEYLQTHPDVHIIDGVVEVKDKDLQKTLWSYLPYYAGRLLPRLLALDSRVFFNVCYMFRREMLGGIRFNIKMTHAEDLLFYMELSNANAANYAFVDETVYWYRSGHVSAMANLEGLERGYVQLLQQAQHLAHASSGEKVRLRLRVARIMFLSWLQRKKPLKAIRSVFVVMNPIGRCV